MKTFPDRRARMTLITKEDIEYFTNRHSFIHSKSLLRAQNFSFSSIYVQFFNASLVVLTANKVGFPEPIFSRRLKCVSRNEDWYSLSLQEHPTLLATRNYNDLGWSRRERNNPLHSCPTWSTKICELGGWRERLWGDLGEFSNLLGGFRLKRWTLITPLIYDGEQFLELFAGI